MRFRDVTEGSGTADTGWTQAVSHTDIDRDGLQDIVIGNDFGYNDVLRNLGDGRFESVGRDLGLDKAYHTMNVGINDLNQDGFPDLYFANIATLVKDNKYIMPDHTVDLAFSYDVFGTMLIKESNMLYLSQASEGRLRRYVDANHMVERGSSSTGWAWDGEYLDWDNDGDEDLYVVNGWNDYELAVTSIDVKEKDPKPGNDRSFVHRITHGRESNVFFVNEGGKLKNRSARSGADFASNSRSTTYLDMDRDGDLDIAVNNFQSPATILRNNAQQRGNHWLIVDLIGDPARRVNRDAIGARIVATTATGLRISREIHGGSGYLSMNPKRQHLGLGKAQSADLHITWPNGETQRVEGLRANHDYVIRQGHDPTTDQSASAAP